jgi:bifunctional non-homologous end joining protein LigD
MIKPMLCGIRKATDVRTDPRWIYEKKYDGERAIIEITNGERFIYARSGREKNRMYPDLQIDVKVDCILDGEIAAATGKFSDIQHRANRENGIKEAAKLYPVKFYAFDILKMGNNSLDRFPLEKRKQLLNAIVTPTQTCEIAPIFSDGIALWTQAKAQGWEGIVGKKLNSHYGFGARGEDWIKIKVLRQGEFWVVGYTTGTGWRESTFGSLILAKFEGDKFFPVGEVGTGFDQREIERLNEQLKSTILPPGSIAYFTYPTPPTRPATWVRPFKVVIEYLETTADGRLRFPSYKKEVI